MTSRFITRPIIVGVFLTLVITVASYAAVSSDLLRNLEYRTAVGGADQSGTQSGGSGGTQGGGSGGTQGGGSGGTQGGSQAPLESEVIAFAGLHKDALAISTSVSKSSPTRVVIYDSTQFLAVPMFRSLIKQINVLASRYCAALPQAQTPGGPVLESLGPLDAIQQANQTLVALLNTLKTTTDMTISSFTISDDALAAEVANNLAKNGVQVFYPALYPLSLAPESAALKQVFPASVADACQSPASLDVLQKLTILIYLRSVSSSTVSKLSAQISTISKDLDSAKSEPESTAKQQKIQTDNQKKDTAQKELDVLTGLNNTFDALLTFLGKGDANGTNPQLNSLLMGERLSGILNDPKTFVLDIKIQKSGGEYVKKSNLFYGTRFYYGGGSIVTYILLNTSGSVVSGGNFWSSTAYQRDKSLSKSKILDNSGQ